MDVGGYYKMINSIILKILIPVHYSFYKSYEA
jgi:hypothetical protein